MTVSHLDSIKSLGKRTDLVNLDKDGVTCTHLDTLLEVLHIGYEEVITYELTTTTDSLGKFNPTFPVFLRKTVLNRVDRISVDEFLEVFDLLICREFLSSWILLLAILELLVVIVELAVLLESEL